MVLEKILKLARERPGKLAAVQDGRRYGYGHLAAWIVAVREMLQAQGLPATGVAVISAGRLIDAWVLGLALRSLGLTTFASRGEAHIRNLRVTGVVCLVAMDGDGLQLKDCAAAAALPLILVPAALEEASAGGHVPELLHGPMAAGGHIMMTSGTTGHYKRVLRDALTESLLMPLHARINFMDENSLVYVSNFGLWTAGGYRWPLIAWSTGAAVVFHQEDDEQKPLLEYGMTHVFSTPEMLSTLLAKLGGDWKRNDDMHVLVTGGAMSRATAAAARQRLGSRLYSVLASTEALTVAVTSIESDEDLRWHRIHPEREVQVVDDAGASLPSGQVGRVRIRILDGLAGYHEDEAATRVFFRDGWFYPGDLGELGADGRLCLHGRSSDVVNVLGGKIATAPVEQALQDRLGLEGVCIVSIRPEGCDDEIHVVVESNRDITREEWQDAIASELRMFSRVHLHIDLIGKLPRNDMGKIQRVLLREQLLASRAARLAGEHGLP